jgi:hypothetical protein
MVPLHQVSKQEPDLWLLSRVSWELFQSYPIDLGHDIQELDGIFLQQKWFHCSVYSHELLLYQNAIKIVFKKISVLSQNETLNVYRQE